MNAGEKILNVSAAVAVRVNVQRLVLSLADHWGLKRNGEERPSFPFIRRRRNPSFQILRYHRVNDEKDPFLYGTPTKMFGVQMETLSRHFHVLPLEELMDRVALEDVPPRAVAITFDDGYRDNYVNAFPVLKALGLPASIFLATGGVGAKTPLWHDRVFNALRQTIREKMTIEDTGYSLRTVSEKCAALWALREHLRKYASSLERDSRIQRILSELNVSGEDDDGSEILCWAEIEEMARHRISFGAHTVTHPILTSIPLAEAEEEIRLSKETIEQKLNVPVRLFAYPNGSRRDFNEPIKSALRDAGFLCAVTILWGTNDSGTDPFELRRMGIWDPDPNVALLKLGWHKFAS